MLSRHKITTSSLFIVLLALSGCATLRLPDLPATALPGDGNGVLVSRIIFLDIANATRAGDPIELTLINQKNLTVASAILPLEPGVNFRVIELPAGVYSWRGIYGYGRSVEFRGEMMFAIKPNAATYVGDMDLAVDVLQGTYDLRVTDRNADVRKRFEMQYPKAAAELPFEVSIVDDKRK